MTRLTRLAAAITFVFAGLLLVPWAHADCSNPMDSDWPCSPPPGTARPHTPSPGPATATPTATTAPTKAPGPRPTRRPSRPGGSTTPAPVGGTIDNIEVPSAEPQATPEIIVEGPVPDTQPLDVAEPSASASSWIFGFIVGLIVGGFVGRASWGLRRKRRQQIFG